MELDLSDEAIAQAKGLVTSFLREDSDAIATLLEGHPDPLLAMALANLASSTVRALAVKTDNDPVELWSRTLCRIALAV